MADSLSLTMVPRFPLSWCAFVMRKRRTTLAYYTPSVIANRYG